MRGVIRHKFCFNAAFRRRSPPKLAISPQFLVIIADLCNATAPD
jgi:hypothetical protein